jgi:phosphoribosylanthranilate isomerase
MKLKVCGLNNQQNILDISKIKPDFIGFIFYPKSKRYIANAITAQQFESMPHYVNRVGVFVNEDINVVEKNYKQYNLDYVQLHGNEDQRYCIKLYLKKIPVIKAFSIDTDFNFQNLGSYSPFCSFFLFDTKGDSPGGNGIKFNWDLLKQYNLNIPIFLSGGISPNDIDLIKEMNHEMIYGIDINSKFEIEPGLKNVEEVEKFKNELKELN